MKQREWEQEDITHQPGWKGGEVKTLGYIFVKAKDHPYTSTEGYVKRSRLVMEKALGRYLKPQEVIHHINRDRSDDRLENLMLFESNGKHIKYHAKLRRQQLVKV